MSIINNPLNVNTSENSRVTSNPKIKTPLALKALGISLIVLGLLLSISGIIAVALTGIPILALLAVIPMLSLVPSGILLIRKSQKLKPSAEPLKKTPAPSLEDLTPSVIDSSPTATPELQTERTFAFSECKIFFNKHFKLMPGVSFFPDQNMYTGKGVTLVCTKGPIERPCVELPTVPMMKSVVYNAANPHIQPGGAGTNSALSTSVTPESWRSTAPSNKKPLKPGEISIGDWESSQKYEDAYGTALEKTWDYLGQILGPKASECNNNPAKAFPIIRKAYYDALAYSMQCSCSVIQLPLVSCGIYAPSNREENIIWVSMVARALWEAVVQAGEERFLRGRAPVCVSVVDYKKIPFAEFN